MSSCRSDANQGKEANGGAGKPPQHIMEEKSDVPALGAGIESCSGLPANSSGNNNGSTAATAGCGITPDTCTDIAPTASSAVGAGTTNDAKVGISSPACTAATTVAIGGAGVGGPVGACPFRHTDGDADASGCPIGLHGNATEAGAKASAAAAAAAAASPQQNSAAALQSKSGSNSRRSKDDNDKKKKKSMSAPAWIKKSQKKIRVRNVGGPIPAEYSESIQREWLDNDDMACVVPCGSKQFVPQVGDAVLYYPRGHKLFLEKHPDHLGKKLKHQVLRVPLWVRARKEKDMEKEKGADGTIQNEDKVENEGDDEQDEESQSSPAPWWNEQWLASMEGIDGGKGGTYPMICRVENAWAEFPYNRGAVDIATNRRTSWSSQIDKMKKDQIKDQLAKERPMLRLAVVLKPLTPLIPPALETSGCASGGVTSKKDRHPVPPPSFTAIIFPSVDTQPFILPFFWTYRQSNSIQIGERVQMKFDNIFYTGRLHSLVDESSTLDKAFARFPEIFDNDNNAMSLDHRLEQLLLLASSEKSAFTIPFEEIRAVLQYASYYWHKKHDTEKKSDNVTVSFTGSAGDLLNSGLTFSTLVDFICATLPRWENAVVHWDDMIVTDASPWELIAIDSGETSVVYTGCRPGNLICTLGGKLLDDLRLSIQSYMDENEEAVNFVAVKNTPEYQQYVPLAMSIQRVLDRLKMEPTATSEESVTNHRCSYYRNVAAVVSDLNDIAYNCVLYKNAPESDMAKSVRSVVEDLKYIVEKVETANRRKLKTKGNDQMLLWQSQFIDSEKRESEPKKLDITASEAPSGRVDPSNNGTTYDDSGDDKPKSAGDGGCAPAENKFTGCSADSNNNADRMEPAWDDYSPDECFICYGGGEILLCDYCTRSYHLGCHQPPLQKVPEGKFKCMECVAVSNWDTDTAPNEFNRKKRKRKEPTDPAVARRFLKSRVAKIFDDEVYLGTVTRYNSNTGYWHVQYDDGDKEDYDESDLEQAGELYQKKRKDIVDPKSRGSQQRYFRRDNHLLQRTAVERKKRKATKQQTVPMLRRPSSASSSTRSQRPIAMAAENLASSFCVVQVPPNLVPGDTFDVLWPSGITTQVICPESIRYSPYLSVVAPGGYQPPAEPMQYARTNADRLCVGLADGHLRPFIVEAFNETLWPVLEKDGWRMITAEESGSGSTFFIPGPDAELTDCASRVGLGYCSSYKGVISFVAKNDTYEELHAAFEADCKCRQEAARKAAQTKRDMNYLSFKPHDTPVGPEHQVMALPSNEAPYVCPERRRRCKPFWKPRFAQPEMSAFLDNIVQDKQDLEGAMDIFCSYNYNDVPGKAVINTQTPTSESWVNINEVQFAAALEEHNHDLKCVAESLGTNPMATLWYYYHRYRSCRQWDDENDRRAFHSAMIDLSGNIKRVADRIGRRFDSCLWFYYCKYRHLDFHEAYKKAKEDTRNHDEYCAICDDGGELMLCSSCPKSYHIECLSLKALPPGDWHCPKCEEEKEETLVLSNGGTSFGKASASEAAALVNEKNPSFNNPEAHTAKDYMVCDVQKDRASPPTHDRSETAPIGTGGSRIGFESSTMVEQEAAVTKGHIKSHSKDKADHHEPSVDTAMIDMPCLDETQATGGEHKVALPNGSMNREGHATAVFATAAKRMDDGEPDTESTLVMETSTKDVDIALNPTDSNGAAIWSTEGLV